MIYGPEYEQNQTAYRSLKPTIDQTYPKGRFVAIHEGKVVADAADLEGLRQAVLAQGKDPMQALAVQATLLAGAAATVAAMWWIGRGSPASPAAPSMAAIAGEKAV